MDLQRRHLADRGRTRATPTPSVWRQVLEVNLTGAFLGARAAARVMGDGGRLIFTARSSASGPRKGLDRLQRLEGRAVGLAKGLALDLAPAGITVNVVAPGWFDSPLADGWKSNPELVGRDHRPHRAAALGRTHRPGRRLPVPRLRRRRRSSPAPCSPSTAGTCSYDRPDGSSRSPAPAARSARRSPQQLAGEPDTDLVLSDVSEPSLEATVAGLPDDRRRRSRRCSPT